jgi:hypothetical protein
MDNVAAPARGVGPSQVLVEELVEWTTTAKALLAAAVDGEAGRNSR